MNLYKKAVAGSFVVATVLLCVSVLLQPKLGGDPTERLAAIDTAGARAAASSAAFTAAQLPFLIALLGIGHLLRERSRQLGLVGAVLGVLGAFGHAVFGGVSLAYVVMAHDEVHRSTYGGLVADIESTPIMVFALLGLAGTVLGLLLLSIGLFRGRVGPRWLGPLLWAFLVTEFAGSSLIDSASYLSSVLAAVAFFTLARLVLFDDVSAEVPARDRVSVG